MISDSIPLSLLLPITRLDSKLQKLSSYIAHVQVPSLNNMLWLGDGWGLTALAVPFSVVCEEKDHLLQVSAP